MEETNIKNKHFVDVFYSDHELYLGSEKRAKKYYSLEWREGFEKILLPGYYLMEYWTPNKKIETGKINVVRICGIPVLKFESSR